MTFRDTSADITLDNANMATKEQIAKLMADDPATIAERLSGGYIYPGAISPMRTPPIEQEAGREIVRLRTEIDALKAENERLRADAERLDWLEAHPRRLAYLEEMAKLYDSAKRKVFEIRKENVRLRSQIKELKHVNAVLRRRLADTKGE